MIKKKVISTKIEQSVVAEPLKDRLLAAVHKVLKSNKSELTEKVQKVINKSIKKIVKKSDKQIKNALKV